MRTAKRNTCKTAAAHDGRDGGAMSAESARWRHRGMRMAARSGVDAMRAMAHFWRSGTVAVGDGCCEGGCAGKGK